MLLIPLVGTDPIGRYIDRKDETLYMLIKKMLHSVASDVGTVAKNRCILKRERLQ